MGLGLELQQIINTVATLMGFSLSEGKWTVSINVSMLKGGKCYGKKAIGQGKGIGSAGEWVAVSKTWSGMGFIETVKHELTRCR